MTGDWKAGYGSAWRDLRLIVGNWFLFRALKIMPNDSIEFRTIAPFVVGWMRANVERMQQEREAKA